MSHYFRPPLMRSAGYHLG